MTFGSSFWKKGSVYPHTLMYFQISYYNDCKSMCLRKQARLVVREPPCVLFVCFFVFLIIIKGNDYFNIHRKFEVHSTNIFGFRAGLNIARWQPPPLSLTLKALPYPEVGWKFLFFAKNDRKRYPTISYSHLVAE